ncbi:cation diffusion facilitator family transporter [Phytoactinopolyspora mesophila]|uniref:Cation diffusion facilitator family transporter n=1 Tax=Phytoactinopolyspora mesophila TaxID=2650750 RepID=A0A7K3M621_9ACTN|nr:cation diffusion facilitator family transporter [Phytoactinopolyspora mesophila]NDL58771.1 cation diffusion facilitator family transporter [Phytoactinopolyspora mesophila]
MGFGHGHGAPASGTAAYAYRRRMAVVLGIIVSITLVQAVGAWLSGSMALLADAAHSLTDGTGVAVALLATLIAARPANAKRTFGLQRVEILAAMTNALIVGVVAVLVMIGGVRRLLEPSEIDSGFMLAAAVVGLAGNLVSLLILRRGQKESLNVRGAYLEVLGDMLGSVAVVAAALVIIATGFLRADAIASILIGVMILPRAWLLLRDVLNVLLEATPKGVDLDEVRQHMLDVPGIVDVHDLHAWTITSGVPVLSAHVVVDELQLAECGSESILDGLHDCLAGHFDIEHSTFQIEPRGHADHEYAQHE